MRLTKSKSCRGTVCCPPIARHDRRAADGDLLLAQLAKALAHPARVQVLRLLSKQSTCVAGAIVEQLPLAQSTVSQHLKILRDAGLIIGCEDGPRICYCIAPQVLARFKALVAAL